MAMQTGSIGALFILLSGIISGQSAIAYPNCTGVPDKGSYFDFTTSCFKHDICYYEAALIGNSKQDCDTQFHNHMMATCQGKFDCLLKADNYFFVVSIVDSSLFFDPMSKRGREIQAKIQASGDVSAQTTFANRALGQDRWNQKDDLCGQLLGVKRAKCLADRDAIVVPDIPTRYRIGICNLLGIHWKKGHRIANASYQSSKLSVPLESIMSFIDDNRIMSSNDPCAEFY